MAALTSPGDEPLGWAHVVQPGLGSAQLSRLDDVTVKVSLPKFPAFSIDAPETVTIELPPTIEDFDFGLKDFVCGFHDCRLTGAGFIRCDRFVDVSAKQIEDQFCRLRDGDFV